MAVPVLAPVPIAFIAACIPVDDGLLDKLRAMSVEQRSIALATHGSDGAWKVVAKTNDCVNVILPRHHSIIFRLVSSLASELPPTQMVYEVGSTVRLISAL